MKKPKSTLLRRLQKSYAAAVLEVTDKNGSPENQQDAGRRKFIRNTALTALNVALFAQLNSCTSADDKEESVDVAIVGGGIAGLHAAHILSKSKVKFKLYEGSGSLGGRIYTNYADKDKYGVHYEFGGEFIDSNHEDMLKLCKEFNLNLLDCVADASSNQLIKDAYFFQGRHYTEEEVIEAFKKIIPQISADQSAIENEEEARLEELDNMSIADYLKKIEVRGWFYDLLYAAFTSEMGMEASEQSSLNLIDMLDVDVSEGFKIFGDSDERYKIEGGNSRLIESLGNSLKDYIALNQSLTGIEQTNLLTKLTFNDSKTVNCKYVILAIPFTILRKMKLPTAWPKEKVNAINNLGYGTNGKVFVGYNGRPWKEQKYAGYLFNEVIQNGWDGTLMQKNNPDRSVYTVFLGGKEGETVSTENAETYINTLDTIYKGSKSALSGQRSAFNWTKNPKVLGSYAAYKKGQWNSVAGNEFTPVGNVFFAGEHCSEDFQGYMNGGAETGRRAAEEVIKALQVKA